MTSDRERKARNHLRKLGYDLKKTPPRHWTRGHFPVGYIITQSSWTVAGDDLDIDGPGTSRDFTLTLEAVEEYVANLAAREVREELRTVLRSYTGFGGDRFVEVAAAMVREAA
jgi:hypothetical protein